MENEKEASFSYDVEITFMYDNDSISFKGVDFGIMELGLLISKKNATKVENTVIPFASIKYYTVTEPKSGGKLEVI